MNKGVAAGVIMLMIGLILLALSASDGYTLAFNKVKIEDTSFDSYEKNEIAEGNITYVVAKVGETELSRKMFGIPYKKVNSSIYLISDNGGYVMIQTDTDTASFDELVKKAEDDAPAEEMQAIEYVGKAIEASDEIYGILEKYFADREIPKEYWENAISLYVLERFDASVVIVQLCISGGFILLGILLIVIFRRYVQGKEVYVGEAPSSPIETPTAPDAEEKADEKN